MSKINLNLCSQTIIVASRDQVSCDLGEEAAILGMKNSAYYGLNPVGARVWWMLQRPRSIGEICEAIVSEYDVSADRCEEDLVKLLQQLLQEGLVELSLSEGGELASHVRET